MLSTQYCFYKNVLFEYEKKNNKNNILAILKYWQKIIFCRIIITPEPSFWFLNLFFRKWSVKEIGNKYEQYIYK